MNKLLIALLLTASTVHANSEHLRKLGDIIQVANPLVGFVVSAQNKIDDEYLLGFLTCMGIAGAGKFVGASTHYLGSQRPNKTAYTGMPSGHTVSAWFPAANLARSGSKDGVLASFALYPAAILTGYSRVASKRHTIIQVLASVAISEGIAILNKKYNIMCFANIAHNRYSLTAAFRI